MRIDILQILSYPNSQISSFRIRRTITTFLLLFLLGNLQGWGDSKIIITNLGYNGGFDKKEIEITYVLSNGQIEITGCNTKSIGNLTLPDYITVVETDWRGNKSSTSYPVTSIGSNAFWSKGIGPILTLPRTLNKLDATI